MMGRRAITILFAALVIAVAAIPARGSDEYSLFDSNGHPVAYLTEDDLSDGFHVYGFNGKHLGWFVSGIIRDHRGDAVGGLKEAFRSPTQREPLKGTKLVKPQKSVAEPPPPHLSSRDRSEIPLSAFLMQGVD